VIRRRGAGRAEAGMTLLEVVLALTVLAVVVVLLSGGVRVAVRAWEAGERQVAAQQETRVVVEIVAEALASALPLRGRVGESPERVLLFEGEPEALRFVTTAAPLGLEPADAPFHAVTLARGSAERLVMGEKLLPATEPFTGGVETTLARAVSSLRLAYRDGEGTWRDRWDARAEGGLPTAVRVELALGGAGAARAHPPVVVPLALGKPGKPRT
jgi:general secretion pathway protein J